MVNEITLSQSEFRSSSMEPRTVWIQRPGADRPAGICLFLDAEYYMAQIRAAPIIDRMQREGQFPPMLTAYVASHTDSLTRWTDSLCNEDFAR